MLQYDIVDVFGERPFTGNPLAVVHGAGGLRDDQLLALAREFNLSETTFPTPVSDTAYDVRIFTPGGELPFAGHPTLGTAWVLRRAGSLSGSEVVQRCLVGEVPVAFDGDLVRLTATPRDLQQCPDELVGGLVGALGLEEADRAGPAYWAGTGLTFLHLPLTDDAVTRARPAYTPTPDGGLRDPIGGVNVYAVEGQHVHARMFAPDLDIAEDPATGSAATGLGVALVARGLLSDGGVYTISQGREVGRPSTLHGSVSVVDGVLTAVSVAGEVHPIATGEITVPA